MPQEKAGAPEAPTTMHRAGVHRVPETPMSRSSGAQAFMATGRLTPKAAPIRRAASAIRATRSRFPAPYPATTRNRLSARSPLDGRSASSRSSNGVGSRVPRLVGVGQDAVLEAGGVPGPSFQEASMLTHEGRAESSKRPTMWFE